MSNVIECRRISKFFVDGKNKLEVLTNVDITVQRAAQISIMGQSGSGKTTLLQLLGGLDLPSSGDVLINGQNIKNVSDKERGNIRNKSLGFVYQFHHLLPEFTALENVAMPLLIREEDCGRAKKEAAEFIKKVGLQDRANHKPAQLSGGERQRIAIARALVTRPYCILADEPTGNLDSENAEHVFNLLKELNKSNDTALIIVTHDYNIASKMPKNYILKSGKLHLD